MNQIKDRRDFAIVVPSYLDDFGLDPYEYRIYSHIVRRAGRNGCFESIPNMSRHCLISEKIVRRSLKVLLESKLIAVASSVPGKSVVYEITPREEWGDPEKLPALREKHTTPGKSATTTPGKSATTTPGKSATTTPGKSATTTPGKSATTNIKEINTKEIQLKELPLRDISPYPQNQNGEEAKSKSALEQIAIPEQPKPEICNSPITPPEVGYSAALKNVYAQAKNVWEMIDTFLLGPDLSDAAIPHDMNLIYREKNKWSGWVWPWRSKTMDKQFQTFNPDVVKKIAADLARKDGARVEQKYGHAIGTLTVWEQTKGGWQKILTLCDRPSESISLETSVELAIPQYIKDWYETQHEYHYRTQFLKAASLDEFFKGKDNQAWYQFAKEKFPSWDWTKTNPKIEDKVSCLL